MATATKEEQLDRLGRAIDDIKRAIHHLALSKKHREKRDWRGPARGAINTLEAALSHEDEDEASNLVIGQCPECFEINQHASNCKKAV